jgi:transposase
VAPGALAVLLLDQAAWHLSDRLIVPPNITLVLLPPKCPELNPVENVWHFIRDTQPGFCSYGYMLEHAALPGTGAH